MLLGTSNSIAAVLSCAATVVAIPDKLPTNSLTPVSNWGNNPTGLELNAYIPSNLPSKPAVILALHPCGFSGPQYASDTKYTSFAGSRGFIALYPTTKNDSNCWDVASSKTLTHDGGGDSTGLANMIQWAISQYNADAARAFVTGSSSGCMMTNVMSATYPEIFAAASCYSGTAAGCLAGSPGSSPISANQSCAEGKVVKTGAQWADQVKAMYPGYNGTYPRSMIWHGTADTFVSYANLAEELKEWSTTLGVSFRENVTNTPQSGYTQMVYGDGTKLLGYSAAGVGHTVPVQEEVDLNWFSL